MPNYMILLYDDPAQWANMGPEDFQQALAKYMAWGDKARKNGWLVDSNKLTDGDGRVLRGKGGQPRVTDGPFTEGKEVLGGYYTIRADDYQQAIDRVRDHPHLEYGGTAEVRQVEEIPGKP
jgi:hypothetical protein